MWRVGMIHLARLGNIDIDVHLTSGLAILAGAWGGWMLYGGLTGVAYGVLAITLLFGCLLLHEFAHGFMAHRTGLVISRITFLPIGILLEVPPASPRQEMLIALVGPSTNLGAALLLGILVYGTIPTSPISSGQELAYLLAPSLTGILLYLIGVNALLGVFNMVPAFPMDGGRILRAGLALNLDYVLATRIAAWLGRILALVMGAVSVIAFPLAGLPPDPVMIFVAAIVYLGARQEEHYVRQQRALVHIEVKDVYQHSAEIVSPWDTVTKTLVVRLFQHEQILPVVIEGKTVGLLTYQDAQKSLGQDAPVTIAHVMRTDFPTLRLRDTLWVALRVMNTWKLAKLPVVQEEVFQGVISLDDIDRAWRVFQPQREDSRRQPAPGDITH